MFGSSVLDVAIGIVLVFFLLSLITSTINEIILSLFNMRGRFLLDGLKTLLNDTNATGLVSKLYNHGQIFSLFKGEFDPKKKGNLPSYIPSQNFAAAFLDVIAPAESTAGTSRLASLTEAAQKFAKDPETEKLGKPLVSMIDAAGSDAAKLKKNVEDWYNNAMERVSGWYKYRTQWSLLGIGLVLAIALNAGTVRIVKQLSNDSTLRQSIVAVAQSAKAPDAMAGQSLHDQIQQVHEQVSKIKDLGIPLGWAGAWTPSGPSGSGPWVWGWLKICGGWLLTAIAISLGAPFWFDILNKIAVVRSTLKPRKRSQEQ